LASCSGSLTQTAGTFTVSVVNPGNNVSDGLSFTLTPALAINSVTPATAGIGAVITLNGTGFDPAAASNSLAFRGVNGTTISAAALSATATQITVRVPPLAESGPITLTNARGTTQSPAFTVVREQDFALVASPAAVTVYQGASNSAQLQLSSTGSQPFTGLVSLSAQGLPPGSTASFSPAATLSASQPVTLTLGAAAGAAPGTYPVTVRGEFVESGAILPRSASLNLVVQASAGVTGVKGRFITPDGAGVAGVIVRADFGPAPQPQTTTDAAGNFQLAGLPAGSLTFRFDATPANPLYPIWPYTTTVVASQIAVIPDWTINPPPADEKFVPIAQAAPQEQVITDPRFPGLEVRIPAGTSIIGWDGVPKTRMAIEKVELTKLPVTPPPTPTGAAYQLYFGTPMGGIPSTPIPVTLPNDVQAAPNTAVDVWFFDGSPMGGTGEWRIAGQAIVSADGKTARMPPGTGIPRFCGVCGLWCLGSQPPPPQKAPTEPSCDGNPVDLHNGQEMPQTGGLSCGGLTPISTGMSYNPVDAFNLVAGTATSLGLGWTLDYDVAFLPIAGPQKRLILPGNTPVNFTDDGSGVYRPFDDPRFDGAEIRATNPAANDWELKFRDGRVWRFKQFGIPTFVTEMIDPQGNSLPIQRNASGRILSVGSGARRHQALRPERRHVREGRYRRADAALHRHGVEPPVHGDGRRRPRNDLHLCERRRVPAQLRVRLHSLRRRAAEDHRLPRPPQPDRELLRPGTPRAAPGRLRRARVPLRLQGHRRLRDPGEHRPALQRTGVPRRRLVGKLPGRLAHLRRQGHRHRRHPAERQDLQRRVQRPRRHHGEDRHPRTEDRHQARRRQPRHRAHRCPRPHLEVPVRRQGKRDTTTDPLGRGTSITYDPVWNKPTSITRFDDANQPQTWSSTYDPANGTVLTATNPLNQATTFAYTARGELSRITDALGHSTSFEYNAAGDRTKMIDALLNETHFGVDGAGRQVSIIDALNNITRTAYNGIDRVTRITDAKLQQMNLAYDAAGRLASVANARSVVIESYAYDSGDRLASRTDAKNRQTLYDYDSFGRLESVTDRRGLATTYAYDEQDRVISMSRAEGVMRFSYDAVGRLVEIADPAGTVSTSATPPIAWCAKRSDRRNDKYRRIRLRCADRRTSRTVVGVANEVTTRL
jgi:YD repeat-containing protein